MNFCRRCGSRLTHKNQHVYVCDNGHTLFANSAPAVGILLVNDENQVLVAKRAINPGKGLLDIPGGFIDGDTETLEQGVEREVKEETGITKNQYSAPVYITSGVDQYDYANETIPVLSTIYWARLSDTAKPDPMDDVASLEFMELDSINLDDVYFPAVRSGFVKLKELL